MGGIGLDVERYSCQIAIYERENSEGARYEGRTEVGAFGIGQCVRGNDTRKDETGGGAIPTVEFC